MRNPLKLLKRWLADPRQTRAPPGYSQAQWEALRDAHAKGYTLYGNMDALRSWPDQHGSEPLFLAHGCKRCGDPLDAKAKDGVCSPCVDEQARRAPPPPIIQTEWWHETEEDAQQTLTLESERKAA